MIPVFNPRWCKATERKRKRKETTKEDEKIRKYKASMEEFYELSEEKSELREKYEKAIVKTDRVRKASKELWEAIDADNRSVLDDRYKWRYDSESDPDTDASE